MKRNTLIITYSAGSSVAEGEKKSLKVKDENRALEITQKVHPSVLKEAIFKDSFGIETKLKIVDKPYYNHGIKTLGKFAI